MPAFLKCDAAGCDHVEDVEAITPELIGKPCPKCGSNLLTEADCEAWLAMVQPGIELAKKLGLLVDRAPSGDDLVKLRLGLHENQFTATAIPVASDEDDAGAP